MKYVFGPVPSRRLGRSLGVDVVPFKTCSYDCIYCQLGRTTHLTIERQEWVPVDQVLHDLRGKLSSQPDFITISGSGEPTLYTRLGELISGIKTMTDVPVAVLTNGSLLWQQEVRDQIRQADLVVPSLDAGDEAMFRAVNRPPETLSFEKMLSGLIHLREEFPGQYWLEILLLGGYTGVDSEVKKLVECVDRIQPDRVQLNTVLRPPAEEFAKPVRKKRLEQFAAMFNPQAEIIADFSHVHHKDEFAADRTEIFSLLRRRPCSVDDIAAGLGLHRNEIVKHLEELTRQGKIEQTLINDALYYKVSVPGDK